MLTESSMFDNSLLDKAQTIRNVQANFPAELTALPQWVVWRYIPRPNKPKPEKKPYRPSGYPASVNDPATWGPFEEACEALLNSNYDGIGFVFTEETGVTGIDLDHAVTDGLPEDWAYDTLKDFPDTYAEYSVSGTGVHILTRSTAGTIGKRRDNTEVYSGLRFFVVTGNKLPVHPNTVEACPEGLAKVVAKVTTKDDDPTEDDASTGGLADTHRNSAALTLSDDQLLQRMFASRNGSEIRALWDGRTGDDHSAADMALCNHLAFWTGNDAARINALFCQSGLYRAEKWDKRHSSDGRTYGQMTIEQAIAGTRNTYSGTRPNSSGSGNGAPPAARKPAATTPDGVERFTTDYGNARRFTGQYGDDARFVSGWGWLVYDGQRWQRDATGAAMRMAKETALGILDEAKDAMRRAERVIEQLKNTTDRNEQERLTEERDKHVKRANELTGWALKSQGDARLKAMLSLAESEIEVVASVDDFDADLFLLNVQNGTLDLRTGELRPHNRADMLTKLAPVEYDPNAQCPRFEQFMLEVFMGDSELNSYAQRALGYTLTGSVQEQCFFFCHGDGANGKSTLFEAFRQVLGPDYWMKMTSETLMVRQNNGIPNDVARLQGIRMVVASEIEEGSRWAEGKLKDMTGGDTIPARYLHHEYFDFKPAFKLFVFGNNKPIVRGTDNSTWRRMRLVPFEASFKGREDKTLPEKLKAEAAGILAWAVRGCLDWQRNGLGKAGKVEDSTEAYREEMDIVGKFVEECCVLLPAARTNSKQLYQAYVEWCREQGINARSQTAFGTQLAGRPGLKKYGGATRGWEGIGLKVVSTGGGEE